MSTTPVGTTNDRSIASDPICVTPKQLNSPTGTGCPPSKKKQKVQEKTIVKPLSVEDKNRNAVLRKEYTDLTVEHVEEDQEATLKAMMDLMGAFGFANDTFCKTLCRLHQTTFGTLHDWVCVANQICRHHVPPRDESYRTKFFEVEPIDSCLEMVLQPKGQVKHLYEVLQRRHIGMRLAEHHAIDEWAKVHEKLKNSRFQKSKESVTPLKKDTLTDYIKIFRDILVWYVETVDAVPFIIFLSKSGQVTVDLQDGLTAKKVVTGFMKSMQNFFMDLLKGTALRRLNQHSSPKKLGPYLKGLRAVSEKVLAAAISLHVTRDGKAPSHNFTDEAIGTASINFPGVPGGDVTKKKAHEALFQVVMKFWCNLQRDCTEPSYYQCIMLNNFGDLWNSGGDDFVEFFLSEVVACNFICKGGTLTAAYDQRLLFTLLRTRNLILSDFSIEVTMTTEDKPGDIVLKRTNEEAGQGEGHFTISCPKTTETQTTILFCSLLEACHIGPDRPRMNPEWESCIKLSNMLGKDFSPVLVTAFDSVQENGDPKTKVNVKEYLREVHEQIQAAKHESDSVRPATLLICDSNYNASNTAAMDALQKMRIQRGVEVLEVLPTPGAMKRLIADVNHKMHHCVFDNIVVLINNTASLLMFFDDPAYFLSPETFPLLMLTGAKSCIYIPSTESTKAMLKHDGLIIKDFDHLNHLKHLKNVDTTDYLSTSWLGVQKLQGPGRCERATIKKLATIFSEVNDKGSTVEGNKDKEKIEVNKKRSTVERNKDKEKIVVGSTVEGNKNKEEKANTSNSPDKFKITYRRDQRKLIFTTPEEKQLFYDACNASKTLTLSCGEVANDEDVVLEIK